MGVKVASGCITWSQASNYWPASSSPQTLASAISSPSKRRRSLTDVALVFRYVHRPAIFGMKLNRYRSFESRGRKSIKHVVSANLDAEFSDEEFCKEIQELALLFQLSDDDETNTTNSDVVLVTETQNPDPFVSSKVEPPEWTGDMIPASIERKANNVELPFSLRIIQRKKQWQEGFREAGESANCSVKKALSSMVFINHNSRASKLHSSDERSFVLRRFTGGFGEGTERDERIFCMAFSTETYHDRFFAIKTFPVNSSGKTTLIGGINGRGGNSKPVASGTDGEESFDGAIAHHRKIIPDNEASLSSTVNPSFSGEMTQEEESSLWKSIVEEANIMQGAVRRGLDRQTMQRFVSPVTAKVVEEDTDSESHFRTELLYQKGLSEEPDNPLLLANYAQFLYIVAQDYDRAEEYFKRASKVEPKDAEALSKYANFLWEVRKDLWAAEEALLEAIAVDPINSYYAATYANFLWNNGPDDACFPFDSPEIANSGDL